MPKNTAAGPLSSDEQDAIRRASKARRRHARKKNGGTPDGKTILDLVREDRGTSRAAAQQERDPSQEHAQYLQYQRRLRQAKKAGTNALFTDLEEGSRARQVAAATLGLFPTVIVPKGKCRTMAAFEAALSELGYRPEQIAQIRALRRAKSVAFSTLKWAHAVLELEDANRLGRIDVELDRQAMVDQELDEMLAEPALPFGNDNVQADRAAEVDLFEEYFGRP